MSVNLAMNPAATPLRGYTEPDTKSMLYRVCANIAASVGPGEVRA
jgi:hypothetical protein